MANTTRRRSKAPVINTESEMVTEESTAATVQDATEETPAVAATPKRKRSIVAKDIDPSQYVIVRNGFQGTLVYRSPRTGERFVWDEFGSEQEMELRELKNAKSAFKNFFVNNWFMFDEDWIIDYLGVGQYYKNAISIDNFDDIFSEKPNELKQTVAALSAGQKKSVAYRAKELINEKKIDSLSVISALEEGLGIELIEK